MYNYNSTSLSAIKNIIKTLCFRNNTKAIFFRMLKTVNKLNKIKEKSVSSMFRRLNNSIRQEVNIYSSPLFSSAQEVPSYT